VTTGGIIVIRQRNATTTLYQFSGTFQINSLIDTDGKAGADIVVPFVSSGSQAS